MKNRLPAVVLMSVIALLALPAMGQSLAEENARLRAELAAAQVRIAELEAELGKATRDVETAVAQRDRLTQLAGLTVEGDRLASREALIETIYNDKEDRTTVRSRADRLVLTEGSRADAYLNVAYSFAGQEGPTSPTGARAVIQTAMSDGDFRGAESAVFVLDGEEMVVPIAEYRQSARSSRAGNERRANRGSELVTIDLDAEQLGRLGRAVTAVGEIGRVRFTLTPDQLATFRAMELRQGG
ncbi:MAG: hypothetical protein AAF823_08925 [Planctomycetota bacterium]